MGLSLEVGILADLLENDEEGAKHFREEFATLNRYLATQGIPAHHEPENGDVWSASAYGYSGLHYLRRIAAHLNLRGTLPGAGDQNASNDPVLQEYYKQFDNSASPRTFDHLIIHSDAEGYYLPQDFSKVLFPGDAFPIAGGMIGSSPRLLDECQRIARALSLPLGMDPESDEVLEATESQGEGDVLWKRYGVESYTCLQLSEAAAHSIRTGAAIVFT